MKLIPAIFISFSFSLSFASLGAMKAETAPPVAATVASPDGGTWFCLPGAACEKVIILGHGSQPIVMLVHPGGFQHQGVFHLGNDGSIQVRYDELHK
ncbi:MAG: hypothetical protein H0X34_17105 [Chthoniobacterales bacterium]|nr:hypothetical protein [Chthoniobacterales bacterium]